MQSENLAWKARRIMDRLRRLLKREPREPEDPFAYVGAPKKRPPAGRSSAAAAELD